MHVPFFSVSSYVMEIKTSEKKNYAFIDIILEVSSMKQQSILGKKGSGRYILNAQNMRPNNII